MIVTCGQCKTRFKIPDEKVSPEKGVKVRCTKCGHTFRVLRDASVAPTDASLQHAAPRTDPFERFGSAADVASQATAPPAVPPVAVASAPGASGEGRPRPRKAEPKVPAPFDFSAIAPPTTPSTPAPGAFDFSALTMPPPQPKPASAPLPVSSTPQFDFSSLGSPQGRQSVAPLELDEHALPPSASLDVLPAPSMDPMGDFTESPTSRPPLPGAFPPAEATADGFFGAPLEVETRRPLLDLPDDVSPEAARGALFELPPPPLPEEPASPVELAPSAEAPGAPALAARSKADSFEKPAEAPRRRTTLGIVVHVGIACFLLAGVMVVGSALLNEGALSRETLTLQGLTGLFGSSAQFPTADISNGLYETSSGRAVFFVRGQITNRSATKTRVVVQADIVEAATVVRSARGLAGAVPSPEELYQLDLSQGDDLPRLADRLAPRAALMAPGATAGFLVAFSEYPSDLKAFRVRLSARAEASEATADRH